MAGLLQLRHFHQGLGDSPHVLAQQENAGGVRQLWQGHAQDIVPEADFGDGDKVGDHGHGEGDENGAHQDEIHEILPLVFKKHKAVGGQHAGDQLEGRHDAGDDKGVGRDLHKGDFLQHVGVGRGGELLWDQGRAVERLVQCLKGRGQGEKYGVKG